MLKIAFLFSVFVQLKVYRSIIRNLDFLQKSFMTLTPCQVFLIEHQSHLVTDDAAVDLKDVRQDLAVALHGLLGREVLQVALLDVDQRTSCSVTIKIKLYLPLLMGNTYIMLEIYLVMVT